MYIAVLWTAKRRERERKRRGVVVPPPRPAFPKKTGASLQARRGEGKREEEVGESEREKQLWAALEKREAEEEKEEKEEEEEEEEEEEGGRSSDAHKSVPTITFRHTAKPEQTQSLRVS